MQAPMMFFTVRAILRYSGNTALSSVATSRVAYSSTPWANHKSWIGPIKIYIQGHYHTRYAAYGLCLQLRQILGHGSPRGLASATGFSMRSSICSALESIPYSCEDHKPERVNMRNQVPSWFRIGNARPWVNSMQGYSKSTATQKGTRYCSNASLTPHCICKVRKRMRRGLSATESALSWRYHISECASLSKCVRSSLNRSTVLNNLYQALPGNSMDQAAAARLWSQRTTKHP